MLAKQLVDRRQVDLSGVAAKRAVGSERADEAPVAVGRRARTEAEQCAVGMLLEWRQERERLEVWLLLGALAIVVGKLSGEHAHQVARLWRRDLEDSEVELVVADHVDEVAAPHNAAGGAQMRWATRPRGLAHLEVAQLAQLERRQILGCRALAVHLSRVPIRTSLQSAQMADVWGHIVISEAASTRTIVG